MPGDLILEVNGQDLRRAEYSRVAHTLKVRNVSPEIDSPSFFSSQTLPHARIHIKLGRLKVSPSQIDLKTRSRSPSANKLNTR